MMKHTFFILTAMLCLFSCQESVNGKQGDTIKLSTDKLFPSAEGGEFEVTTQGKYWNIGNMISVDSKSYGMGCDSLGNNCYWDYNGIAFPIEMDNRNGYHHYIVKIEGPWFTVHRITDQKIIFFIQPNDTGKTRTLILDLHDMNFWTGITLTQSAD